MGISKYTSEWLCSLVEGKSGDFYSVLSWSRIVRGYALISSFDST